MECFKPFSSLLVSQQPMLKAALTLTSGAPPAHQQRLLMQIKNLNTSAGQSRPLNEFFPPTLSGQVKRPLVCLGAVKHRQGVFALIILSWVLDFQPDFLCAAAHFHPGTLLNPLISAWTGKVMFVFTKFMRLRNIKLPLFNLCSLLNLITDTNKQVYPQTT